MMRVFFRAWFCLVSLSCLASCSLDLGSFPYSPVGNKAVPTDGILIVNSQATFTSSVAVTLTLSASNAAEMYVTNTAGCATGGSWENYATSKSWTLGQTNSTATVFTKFRNGDGEGDCVSGTIVHDDIGPAASAVVDDGSTSALLASSPNTTWTACADSVSGVAFYQIAVGTTPGATDISPWGNTASNASATVTGINLSNGNSYYASIRAVDNAGNVGSLTTGDGWAVSSGVAPSSPAISINGGDSFTTTTSATLSLSAIDAFQMYVTNTAGCGSGGSWEIYATSKEWTLAQTNATATVYVKYRNSAGESACVNDTILHDNTSPSTPASVDDGTSGSSLTSSPSISWAASTDAGSGIASYQVAIGTTAGATDVLTWTSAGSGTSTTVNSLSLTDGNTYYASIRAVDNAGNTGSARNGDGWIVATAVPSSPTASINSAATYTTSTSATLTLSALQAIEMYVTNTAGCGSGGSWENYATSKSWTLGQTNATATVYVMYRNAAGNSSCANDTIIHDDTAPSTSASLDDGSSSASLVSSPLLTWAASSDAGSGVASYQVAIGTTAGATDVLTWTAAGSGTSTTVNSLSLTDGNTYYASIRAVDNAGNTGSARNGDGWLVSTTAPTSPTISIAVGATYTTTSSVTLALSASRAIEMYATNTAGCASGGSWENYATSKSWTLGQTNATATAYVIYRNAAGSSSCANDTIIHDDTVPTTPGSLDDGTTSSSLTDSPLLSWTASTDGGSGLAAYQVAIGSTSGGTDIQNWTSVGNVLSTTVTGLSLTNGNTYYASVRAIDTAGNTGTAANGNGWTVSTGATWAQQAYIKAPNSQGGDNFGYTVSINGDTAIVGSFLEDSNQTTITNDTTASSDNTATDSGAAYIFVRSGTSWSQQAYVKAPNAEASDGFGASVSISGNTAVVGAYLEDSNESTITNGQTASSNNAISGSGATYVFTRSGTSWSQQAYIKAPNRGANDRFGTNVSVSSDTVIVGVPYEDSNQTTITNGTSASSDDSASFAGAAYVFARSGTAWSQQAYLKAPNAQANDEFGINVSVNGESAIVGAYFEASNQTTITNGQTASSDNSADDSGAAYVFNRSGTSWSQQAYLKAPNPEASDYFGNSVSINGDTAIVGAADEDSNQTTITNGTTASSDNSASGAGAVYVFTRSGSNWSQQAYIKAPNAEFADEFGWSVAVTDDTAVVGSAYEDSNQLTITNGATASSDNSVGGSGAAYVFTRSGSNWSQQAYIKAPNADASDSLGKSVSISGDTAIVGANSEDSNQTTITNGTTASSDNSVASAGAVYIFTRQ